MPTGGSHHTSCLLIHVLYLCIAAHKYLQHYTFYDFIVNKARGKSGPLFNFDVHDDVRLLADATVEKDESHAGKVVERSWYQRNKHIFPASRWEVRHRGIIYQRVGTYDCLGRYMIQRGPMGSTRSHECRGVVVTIYGKSYRILVALYR